MSYFIHEIHSDLFGNIKGKSGRINTRMLQL